MKVPGFVLAAAFALAGCDLAPPYTPPAIDVPGHFKEDAVWRPAKPSDRQSHGAWWTGFRDPVLDRLEAKISPDLDGSGGNFDLALAESNYPSGASDGRRSAIRFVSDDRRCR